MKLSDLQAYSVKTVEYSASLKNSSEAICLSPKVRENHQSHAKGTKPGHLKVKESKYYSNKIIG